VNTVAISAIGRAARPVRNSIGARPACQSWPCMTSKRSPESCVRNVCTACGSLMSTSSVRIWPLAAAAAAASPSPQDALRSVATTVQPCAANDLAKPNPRPREAPTRRILRSAAGATGLFAVAEAIATHPMCPTFKQARRRTQSRSLGRPARLIKVNRMRNIDPLDGKAMRGLLRCCAARARCGDFSAAGKTGRSQNQNQRHHDAEADFLAAGGKQELHPID